MRRIIVMLLFGGFVVPVAGQVMEKGANILGAHHELKANVLNALAFKAIDVNYEYLLDDNSSIGLGVFFKVAKKEVEQAGWMNFEVDNNRSYSLTPYYRRYFSRGKSNGLFIEGFGMLNSGETLQIDLIYDEPQAAESQPSFTELKVSETYSNFALGISFGGKFIKTKGFLMEIYMGMGIDLADRTNEAVTRGGLSLGYRF